MQGRVVSQAVSRFERVPRIGVSELAEATLKNILQTAVLAGALLVIAMRASDPVVARSKGKQDSSATIVKTPSPPSPIPIPYPNASSRDSATGQVRGRRTFKPANTSR